VPRPVLYHPLFQYGKEQAFRWGYVSYEVRYRTDAGLAEEARRIVASVDRTIPVFRMKTLRAQVAQSLLKEQLLATLGSFFGFLAVLLACLGLYGLTAYTVSRRTAEIGIRMALGGSRAQVMWPFLRETMLLAGTGIAIGLPLALYGAVKGKALLFGVDPIDAVSICGTAVLLAAVAITAGYLPVRRATRVDPTQALRYK